ncbi:rhamnogalacturonan lyase [uncultured Duncaniella sp.]|uniref:rhamnogalacturonan lyase n=2 Tax=uncultured Duncaniella sp. TaxID=2768039 RepID=UPI0035102B2A
MPCLMVFLSGLTGYAQSGYDFSKIKMEKLDRGLVAVRASSDSVALSWRYLSSDPTNQAFDLYRDGKRINKKPLTRATFYKDCCGCGREVAYEVRALKGRKDSGCCTLLADAPVGYLDIPLDVPARGVDVFGREYTYSPNDASVGDVDGDGQYEIFLKWEPSNAHDNAHDGFTGPVLIDCYRLDGSLLWRIDLGHNIRAGAHYTQFLVADFDGDGHAELICKTADGTIDGTGRVIGDYRADFRSIRGRIIAGPEYLTVFNGLTGEAMATVPYIPPRGELKDWGDSYANRSERYLAATAYLDGVHPSAVMCRGYYTRSVLAAYDWDGRELKSRWVFDSALPGLEGYSGQGNHNLRVADVDGDGCDEILYGQMAVNNDGTGLYTTGMRHGDAMHILSDPDNRNFYIWGCHENRRDGTSLRDAATGKVIFQFPSKLDIGRCMAADIDSAHPGVELWSPNTGGVRAFDGSLISPSMGFIGPARAPVPVNMAVWWDGDLLRELLDRNVVSKYNPSTGKCEPIVEFKGAVSNNGTKATPCLQGDILGDWREEVLMRSADNASLRLYVSTIPTSYRFHTFLEDPVYRHSIANQNVGYNQPTQPGFYFGPDLKGRKFRGSYVD